MSVMPDSRKYMMELDSVLESNLTALREILCVPANADIIVREFSVCGFDAALIYLEGMAGGALIGEGILEPCLTATLSGTLAPKKRLDYLEKHVLRIAEVEQTHLMQEVTRAVLDGRSALLCEGCDRALLLETRVYEKRGVDRPQNESVIIGPQQGFVENLRTNMTLIHRIVRSPMLISEMMDVGSKIPTRISLMYLRGVANERVLMRIRRRIQSLCVEVLPDSGHLEALIEDAPMRLVPQMLQTERPDRAANAICDGQVAILVDNSPFALIAPVTLFHLLHAADDDYMRWPYALFTRIMRLIGLVLAIYLPCTYVALTLFHPQVIPLDLLTSIAETRAIVPFSVPVETLILELSFFLINEAGTHMPTRIGSALGIVGGLIMGQAAVAADIISPILVVIVAISGLGSYTAPIYQLTIAIEIIRLGMIVAAAFMGVFGIIMLSFICLGGLCAAHSFGVPLLSPFAPYRSHEADLLIKVPHWREMSSSFIARPGAWLGREGRREARGWKQGETGGIHE